jgi:hypothetical protein
MAVLFRQTNIMWVGFFVASRIVEWWAATEPKEAQHSFLSQVVSFMAFCAKNALRIVATFWPFVMLAGSFSVFLHWNEYSVTVGSL